MLEIVFSNSACGSLKMAQHFGQGECHSGGTSVIVSHHDGSEPTQEEIEAVQREAEKQQQLAWEKAVPLGGNAADVFGFNLALSIGDISEIEPSSRRQDVISQLFSIYPEYDEDKTIQDIPRRARETLDTIRSRVEQGESVRVWCSNKPDDMCGMYWFMAWLISENIQCEQISLVQLPQWDMDDDGNVQQESGWNEVAPEEWHKYLTLTSPLSKPFIQTCAQQWQSLQKENAPLRVVLNGQLVGVSETIYDDFIAHEIAVEENEFQEAMVVGRVLGKYCLGVGDAWVALRIEKMIRDGKLEPITQKRNDKPIYHRTLRKVFPQSN